MTGLVLRLAPNEKVLINGAVVSNGPRRTKLNVITPDTHILRLRDAIHPSDANTPVGRVCYALQMILIGEKDFMQTRMEIAHGIADLIGVFRDKESRKAIRAAEDAMSAHQPYQALKSLKTLMGIEAQLLNKPMQ